MSHWLRLAHGPVPARRAKALTARTTGAVTRLVIDEEKRWARDNRPSHPVAT
jgi:hypothetical protein